MMRAISLVLALTYIALQFHLPINPLFFLRDKSERSWFSFHIVCMDIFPKLLFILMFCRKRS
jgi:hypothetical protein